MIFQQTWEWVIEGRKTQTRRRRKPTHEAIHDEDGTITAVTVNGRRKWQVGKTYSVQPGRSKAGVARIRLTGIREEEVTRISEADARAEGYKNREVFFAVWRAMYDEDALEEDCWVLEFELASPDEASA